nr:hypothetical protein [Tanacetum cinerariifolium]
MDHQHPTVAKIPVLDTGKFEQWQFRIQQYLQHEHYALWEVIKFSDLYVVPANTTDTTSSDKSGRTLTLTAEDIQRKKNDVKARTTLLLSFPDEHQLRFSKYKTAKELWAAILKTFGGNEATKKMKKNLLKQQYGNFKAKGSETLEQTFNRLQVIVGQLQFMDVEIKKDDLNQKFLISFSPEWLMHTIVWRNRSDLNTMSLDDLYNHLKVYESEVQKKPEANLQNMAIISSAKHSSEKEDGNTASVPTASTNVPTTSASIANISPDTACAYIASQSSGSQIKFKDINQIDKDDMEEMDIKWNMALLSMRADKFWKKTGKKISIQGSDVAGFDKSKSYMVNDEEDHALVADEVAPTEFDLMANTSVESKTGLPECADDTVTDYSRPSSTIESTSKNYQNRNTSVSETVASPITSKPFIKFARPIDSQSDSKTDKKETPKKPPVKTPRQHNMYFIDLNNIVPHRDLTCLVAKASANECMLWHRRLGFLKPFGCHVMILNTLDNLGKFEEKGDEGYFIGYLMSSKAFSVFNKRTRRVEENLHVEFLENKAIEKGLGPNWLFDINSLTKSMNYVPVDGGTISTNHSGTKDAARQEVKKDVSSLRYIALPNWAHDALLEFSSSQPQDHCSTKVPEGSGNSNPTASTLNPPTDQMETLIVETPIPTVKTPSLDNILSLTNRFEDILRGTTNLDESNGEEADISNMETAITGSPTHTLRIHKDHPKSQIIGPIDTPIQTKNKSKEAGEQSFIAIIHQKTDPTLLQFCLFSSFLSQVEPKKISDGLQDPSWVEAMQEELLQFKIQNVWTLVVTPPNWVAAEYGSGACYFIDQ